MPNNQRKLQTSIDDKDTSKTPRTSTDPRLESIDKGRDLVLFVWNDLGDQRRLLVSSKVLSLASQPFAALFDAVSLRNKSSALPIRLLSPSPRMTQTLSS